MPDTRREPTTATSALLYTQWYHPQASKPSALAKPASVDSYSNGEHLRPRRKAQPAQGWQHGNSGPAKEAAQVLPQERSKGVQILAYKTEQQPQVNQIQRSRCSMKGGTRKPGVKHSLACSFSPSSTAQFNSQGQVEPPWLSKEKRKCTWHALPKRLPKPSWLWQAMLTPSFKGF